MTLWTDYKFKPAEESCILASEAMNNKLLLASQYIGRAINGAAERGGLNIVLNEEHIGVPIELFADTIMSKLESAGYEVHIDHKNIQIEWGP